jgi:hypothetical protein
VAGNKTQEAVSYQKIDQHHLITSIEIFER